MNDHLKRIRRSQTLHIWGNLIKKKRSQQIVHTFSHLPEHADALSNPRDEAINPSDWKMPQQKYVFVNCRHWQIIYKLYRAQVQSALQGVQATCLRRSLRLWPLLRSTARQAGRLAAAELKRSSPRVGRPSARMHWEPTKRPACWASRPPRKVVWCSAWPGWQNLASAEETNPRRHPPPCPSGFSNSRFKVFCFSSDGFEAKPDNLPDFI